jgi:U3 small nucleolar RNA-associated protein 14
MTGHNHYSSKQLILDCAVQKEAALAANNMTAEELQARRDAMARNNALLFYAEQKARRVKRIKSKAYHRRLKKATDKTRAALGLADGEGDADGLRVRCNCVLLRYCAVVLCSL